MMLSAPRTRGKKNGPDIFLDGRSETASPHGTLARIVG
jgi:hypothetical protein